MSIIKCPRCDINFIREEEQYCSICKLEMKGEAPKDDAVEMCIECGEHPAAPGEELCIYCLNDRKAADEETAKSDGSDDLSVDEDDIGLDMEIVPMQAEDIPEDEREKIHRELGFEDADSDDEEDEDEDDRDVDNDH